MAGHILHKKVQIGPDTARYYLVLEQVFVKIWESLNEDPINRLVLSRDPQIAALINMDMNTRYAHRSELHDNWAKAIGPTPRNGLI